MKISVAMAYYNGGMYIEEQMDTILVNRMKLSYLLMEQVMVQSLCSLRWQKRTSGFML